MVRSGDFTEINPQEELRASIQRSYLSIFLSDERIEELVTTGCFFGVNGDWDEDIQALYFDWKYPNARQYIDPREREMFS